MPHIVPASSLRSGDRIATGHGSGRVLSVMRHGIMASLMVSTYGGTLHVTLPGSERVELLTP